MQVFVNFILSLILFYNSNPSPERFWAEGPKSWGGKDLFKDLWYGNYFIKKSEKILTLWFRTKIAHFVRVERGRWNKFKKKSFRYLEGNSWDETLSRTKTTWKTTKTGQNTRTWGEISETNVNWINQWMIGNSQKCSA